MQNGAFVQKSKINVPFHSIFKYMIFQRRQKGLSWSKGLTILHFNRLHVLHLHTWVKTKYFQTLEMQILKFGVCPQNSNYFKFEPRHEISNNVVCATSKASDQPAHMRSLIRAFASHLNIL